jgi:hypothetical protein
MSYTAIIADWPDESREAAQAVIDKYGEPDEATEHLLIWYQRGSWKKIVASKAFYRHDFPMPHTAGEVSARCNDEEANRLALNLMHDIVTGARSSQEARTYYANAVLDFRRGKSTPYMDDLRFPANASETGDPDVRMLSDQDLKRAMDEGKRVRA